MTSLSTDHLPVWALFVLAVSIVLVAVAFGYRAGLIWYKRSAGGPEGPVGSVVGSVLGLLAFMLAFTFSLSAGRFDMRKQLLLDDVNAIGTSVLRAELLPEPHRSQCRELLRQYVDLRVAMAQDKGRLIQGIKDSESIQDALWAHVTDLARADMDSPIGALFVESLNNVFDLHTSRVTVALQYRIPIMIWIVLGGLTALGMAGVGYQFGLAGRASLALRLLLAFSFSLVVVLIADLDRSTTGLLKVSQRPMLELQKKLAQPESTIRSSRPPSP